MTFKETLLVKPEGRSSSKTGPGPDHERKRITKKFNSQPCQDFSAKDGAPKRKENPDT